MARPSRTGGKTSDAKARNAGPAKGRKTTKPKRYIAPAATRAKRGPASDPSKDLKEAREQQAATAEILKVIASSPDDVLPVLEAVAERTMSLLDAWSVLVTRFDGELLHFGAARGALPDTEQFLRNQYPMRPEAAVFDGRCILERSAINISDARVDPSPQNRDRARLRGFRAALSVPMLRDGQPRGVISVSRSEAGAFAANEVELLQTFADQAVIAIENVRLFNETREALERQTATADILKVIASSPSDVQPVFDAIAHSAKRLIGGFSTAVHRVIDDTDHLVAFTPTNPESDEVLKAAFPRHRSEMPAIISLVENGETAQIVDSETADGQIRKLARARGWRSATYTPLMNQGTFIGFIVCTRRETGMLADHHVRLLRTFADQAVIAIENVRLFDEVQARTRGLTEALTYQTGSANILSVIASSPTDVVPVLKAIVESACELCDAEDAGVILKDGDELRFSAHHGPIPIGLEKWPINRNWVSGRAFLDRKPVHVHDLLSAEGDEFPDGQEMSRRMGHRTTLSVPLLRENESIGVIGLRRTEVHPFSDKQISLLQTFADQAVIAIENTRLFNETREALERQTATADILKVIASSPSDVQPVFEAIVGSAKRLLSGHGASLYRVVDGMLHLEAFTPFNPEADEVLRKSFPVSSSDYPPLALVARGASFQFADTETDAPEFQTRIARLRGFRSILLTPLIHDGTTTGLVMVTRAETGSFADNHVRLMKTFADQAVIAIENTRLFNMVRQRTDDLSEALQQQTATADVLKVIASSPTDVGPTLRAIVEGACRFCDAYDATVLLKIEDHLHYSAHHGPIPVPREAHRITRQWVAGRSVVDKVPVQISDFLAPEAAAEFPEGQRRALEQGHRCTLAIPLLQEGEAVGAIGLRRLEPVAFSTKQVRLLQTFADQAVIAIENTRLFDELRQSLQQQTATADVLKVISRSSVDLETVLDTLVGTVARLCRADQAFMYRRHADGLHHLIAKHGLSEEAKAYLENNPFAPDRGTTSGRVALERRPIHIPDVLADPDYTYMGGQQAAGFRTLLGLPLLREDTLIGVFVIGRTRVDPFTNKEVELATSFADQAVIAIENARLFEELRERQAELRVTFDNMGDGVVMFDAAARLTAWNRNFQEMLDLPDAFLAQRPSYAEYFRYLADRGEYSTDLEAELSRANEDPWRELRVERTRPDGRVVEVRRNPVTSGGFVLIYSDITERKHAEEAIRTARDAAEAALRDLQTAQDRLIQTEKLASLGQLTAGIAHEIKNPLNFVNNFSAVSAELTDELNDTLKPVAMDSKVREEVDELTGMLKDNLEKVVQHGKRADSIVKNMLLHSRQGGGELCPADINALVDESLNLAYHGARAEKGEFNITLQRDFDTDAGTIELFPQEITRAFLNLIANGVYAATKRKTEEKEPGFEPTLRASTKNLGTTVEIRIRDNGTGILAEVQEKMFNPFFTTKPAGEGTGLGLSMTHDIIVKQHGGRIDVDTKPGIFTEFIITLPRTIIPPKTAGGTN